jgi:hypothetical protein
VDVKFNEHRSRAFRSARGQERLGIILALLSLSLAACRRSGDRASTAPSPFRVLPETKGTGSNSRPAPTRNDEEAASTGGQQVQTVTADLDGDGTADTLCLSEQPAGATDAEGVPTRHVRLTVVGHRGRFAVVDETWAVAGKLSLLVSDTRQPPLFAVGVPATGDLTWYHWDGSAYRVTSGTEPGFE